MSCAANALPLSGSRKAIDSCRAALSYPAHPQASHGEPLPQGEGECFQDDKWFEMIKERELLPQCLDQLCVMPLSRSFR